MTSSLSSRARAQLDALVTDTRRKAGERIRSPLERSLEELQRSLAPPAAVAPPARVRPPRPPPAARPVRGVRLQLPGGRTLVAATPPLARSDDLAALARTCAANDGAAHRVLVAHDEALARLDAAVEELRAAQQETERRAELALVGLLQRLSGLRRAVQGGRRASGPGAGAARALRERRAVAGALRRQAVEARVQRLNAVVQTVQSAAYGRRGSVLDPRNLVLAGNQLLWSFVDPLLRTLGVWAGPTVSPLAQLAPLGSLITGAAALERPRSSFKGGGGFG